MRTNAALRLSALLLGMTAVSGCLGNGNGGGAKVTAADYDDTLTEIQGRAPTTDMPRVGTASYAGATKLTGQGALSGEVVGQVELDVTFDAEPDEAITGTAHSFVATIDGEEVAIEGTLSTDGPLPSALAINEFTVNLPTGGSQTVTTGAVSINMSGDVVTDDGTSTVLLSLGGNFVGPGGEAIWGPALIQEFVNGLPGDSMGSGTWFVLKQ